ncbi:MAG TPA: DedA family protein [Chloroflexota bacterium]|nr:DedA family protein [Chloroflexota bacterium]
MDAVAEWGLHLLNEHAEWALFLVLLLEESGIPLPLPGDLVMMLAGVRVAQGRTNPLLAIFLMESATLIGSSALYWLARRGGRPVLYRYGKFLHLELDKLERAEDFLRRHGRLAIVAGRVIPGLRIPTTLASGVFGVPYLTFLPPLALGASIYILFFFFLGLTAGPGVVRALEGPHFPLRTLADLAGVGLAVAAYIIIRRRAHLVTAVHAMPERKRIETALMAGLFATATMSLVLDLLINTLATVGHTTPAAALFELARAFARHYGVRPAVEVLVAAIALYVVLQLLWAVAYSHVERWLPEPDWLGGLLFALMPLAFSLWVVLPALGAGVAGLSLGMGLVPLGGEVIRNGIFGWALSTSYTLLTRARAAPRKSKAPVAQQPV